MNWIELKQKIYYCDGSLRDIYVLQTSVDDNKKLTEYVNKNYPLKWSNNLNQTEEDKIDFNIIKLFWEGNLNLFSTVKVLINKVQVNNHFFAPNEIENDVDPREVNSLDDHKNIISYMSDLSNLLNKPVILTPENEQGTILIKVTKNSVEYSYTPI
ncbi:MAG: hypothetical protein V4667_09915 [Bacteroidota bacterium]